MNNLQLLKDMLFENEMNASMIVCYLDEIIHRVNVIGEKCDKMKAIYGIMDKKEPERVYYYRKTESDEDTEKEIAEILKRIQIEK